MDEQKTITSINEPFKIRQNVEIKNEGHIIVDTELNGASREEIETQYYRMKGEGKGGG